jgi:hypothetical protein
MSNKNIKQLANLRPTIFTPSIIRNIKNGESFKVSQQLENISGFSDSSIGNTGSFRYDPYGTGLKSTQQLEVDWSDFSNHTFFNSAQVKVNVAFEKILNKFPIGGTKKDYELFFDNLSGFEKYVYDKYPKYQGYLFLSRSTNPVDGTYIEVKDVVGAIYPQATKKATGKSVLNPGNNSITFETWLFLPKIQNGNSIVFQKLNKTTNGYHGFTFYLSGSTSINDACIGWTINSGSYSLDISGSIEKGKWNHIAFVWDRNPTELRIKYYLNNTFVSQSSQIDIGILNFDSANLYIGSGSAFSRGFNGTNLFIPTETLSGAMKELRFWHEIRSEAKRKEFSVKSVYSTEELKLYYKFNEPSGSYAPIVIDSSGKDLHGTLFGVNLGIRNIPTSSIAGTSPVIYENAYYNPILLPDCPPIETLRKQLLVSASIYDEQNPNLIIKLIPQHYFQEGKIEDSLETIEGSIVSELKNNNGEYNSAKLGSTQILLMLLYTWATFFDEMKLYLDAFSNTIHVDYDSADTVPDQFLQFLAKKHGIELPPLFVGSSIEQFINSENPEENFSNSNYSLQYIQNKIWRRILVNMQDFITSKGTVHSVKSFIRAIGIDPDSFFRIREYGGPTHKSLKVSRESRSEVSTTLTFDKGGFIYSPPLISPRIEPGYPLPKGSFLTNSKGVNIGTTVASDNLLTSGSWTYEALYTMTSSSISSEQSLVRFVGSGSNGKSLFLNLVANTNGNITLYLRPSTSPNAIPLSMSFSNLNIFDGDTWAVSFGRKRGDSIGLTSLSSSYFLRIARQNFGSVVEEYVLESYYDEHNAGSLSDNVFTNLTTSYNSNGVSFEIGSSGSFLSGSSTSFIGLNNTTYAPDSSRITAFSGKISQIRFWSKDLTLSEWREHIRNFKSIGVVNPKKNFNFENKISGSFEKLRIDASTDQINTDTDNFGKIEIFDFSQNNFHLSGNNFPPLTKVIIPKTFYYSFLSPHFDESSTENKVRVRSFLDLNNILNDENYYAEAAPRYEILKSETSIDNLKFSIDFSIVESLNQDIINIFATLDEFDNAIGNPALLYSPDYPSLEILRNIYFNRLSDKINLKNFYELYKWFDTNIGYFLLQLIPRKTKFSGTNFVVQSHLLERPKVEYQFYEQYLGDSKRNSQKDSIFLQFLTGKVGR